MTITLPTSPLAASAKPRLVANAVQTQPIVGGVVQRKARLGTRWALDVTLPPMKYTTAMAWMADLASSETQEVVLTWPQPPGVVGDIGAPVVNGGGQAGSMLAVRGVTPGYVFAKGLFFSIYEPATARRYLHQVAGAVSADGSGNASLGLNPMLRLIPTNGAPLEFYTPKIQGWAQVSPGWDIDTAMNVGLSLSVSEGA